MTPRLTLNLGVRYDIDFNLMDQENHYRNATREVLEAIGIPGGLPKASTLDISPRVGFAYDLSGDGGKVVRGGYGLYSISTTPPQLQATLPPRDADR